MKAFIDSIQQIIQHPRLRFHPCLIALSSDGKEMSGLNSNQLFFIAKDFSKQASYFFRVESNQEYVDEKEEVKKIRTHTIDLNYSVGLKRLGKWVVFPLVFCWIVMETAFEFIVDSHDDEIDANKQEKDLIIPEGNWYQRPEL